MDKICVFCGEEINLERVNFNNNDEIRAFTFMNHNESSHIECYIKKCFEEFHKEKK